MSPEWGFYQSNMIFLRDYTVYITHKKCNASTLGEFESCSKCRNPVPEEVKEKRNQLHKLCVNLNLHLFLRREE